MKNKSSLISFSLRGLYTIWAGLVFVSIFLALYPFIFVFLQRRSWKRVAHRLVRLWGQLFFLFSGIRIKVTHHFKPDPKQTYVFCSNHFSYVDIAVVVVIIHQFFSFVGKNAMKKIPLFGYLYASLNILVDRNDKNSRASSLSRSLRALQSGRSIVIFPEGGIVFKQLPYMGNPLKDGAFIMAIQQQVPIVPMSFHNNHQIMDEDTLLMRPGVLHVEIHPPIETLGLTMEDLPVLREKVFESIQNPILAYYGLK
ncbi:lysophospholipid acyltransferase family protein [Aquirufa sp.]|jgi:1-acyl-sn-glycerol-3-phosphate acyltransferase|uniref:lysophospholipid acyltransferase family protein n=1 Tax=Aquirufa sp. TaxID=2676249 RepID=UPI0037851B36